MLTSTSLRWEESRYNLWGEGTLDRMAVESSPNERERQLPTWPTPASQPPNRHNLTKSFQSRPSPRTMATRFPSRAGPAYGGVMPEYRLSSSSASTRAIDLCDWTINSATTHIMNAKQIDE